MLHVLKLNPTCRILSIKTYTEYPSNCVYENPNSRKFCEEERETFGATVTKYLECPFYLGKLK